MWRIIFLLASLAGLVACTSSPPPVLPPVSLLSLSNEFPVVKRWSVQPGNGAMEQYLQLTPAIFNGKAYLADVKGRVAAIDITNGNLVWQRDTGMSFSSGIEIAGDNLLVGTSQGEIIALDIATAEIRWRNRVASEILATPRQAKGVVVVRCVDGGLYGFSLKTGERLWLTEQRTPALSLRGTSAPAIAGDIVLTGYDTGKLIAYNLQTGNLLWQATIAASQGRTDLERMIDIDGDPIVVDDVVYVVAFQGRLAAVQLGSGRILWTRDLDSYVGMSIDAYRIYLTSSDGVIWALDRNNGSTLWKQDGLMRRGLTRPQLHKQYLIVGDFNGFLHWMRRDTGKLVARTRVSQPYSNSELDSANDTRFAKLYSILTAPLVNDSSVIAMNRYGHLECFDVTYP